MIKPPDLRYIIIHCSKTWPRQGDGLAAVERKCRLRGALSCGYHYVISRKGIVESGRPLSEWGNHTLGYNQMSLGVCLVGMPGKATPAQKKSLKGLLERLKAEYPEAKQVTHEELQPTSARGCPGFKLENL